MKTFHKISATLFAVCLFGLLYSTAVAQYTNTSQQTTDATARIIVGITLTKTQDLDFGVIVASALGGTVDLAPDNTPTYTGVEAAAGSVTKQAMFDVTGEAGYSYDIGLPTSPIVITNPSSNTMSVGTFVSDPATSSTLSGGGNDAFNVGATLTVGATQAPGIYTGTFDVTVAYR